MLPHISQYLSQEQVASLAKLAEKKEEGKAKGVAKTIGTGLLGMGLGTLAGAGTVTAADFLSKKLYNKPLVADPRVRAAIPILGAGGGLAYSLWKAKEMEEIQRVLSKNSTDERNRRFPRE